MEPRKRNARWSFRFLFSGSRATAAYWLAACRPTGVEDHEQMDIGVPQKPGRPCCFHVKFPAERPDYQLQVRRPLAVATEDTK